MIMELHLKHPVAGPVTQVPLRLESFFSEHGRCGVAIVAIRAPIAFPGLPRMIPERDCIASIVPIYRDGSSIGYYEVWWESADGGPFPHFVGTLSARSDDQSCWLALVGRYEAPLGAGDGAFDAIVGRRIAESTGAGLLERIASYIEQSDRVAA